MSNANRLGPMVADAHLFCGLLPALSGIRFCCVAYTGLELME